MPHCDLQRLVETALQQRRQAGLLRQRRELRPVDAVHVDCEGRRLVNFASNNYLGLTHHPKVLSACSAAMNSAGAGAGAAALITGHTTVHASAESAVARWKGVESAILLPSGYQANHAAVQVLSAIAEAGDHSPTDGHGRVRFLIDKLVHASLVDAVRGSQQPYRVYPHNHLGKLERLLVDAPEGQLQVVVTESIFSMDGDPADLAGLAELKRRHSFVLLLDEAHASGVYGSDGSGYAREVGLAEAVDLSVVTFSKALGVMGGAVCGSRQVIEAVINYAPAAIFSTHLSPVLAGAVEAAVSVLRDEPHRRQRVRQLARVVRWELTGRGLTIPSGDSPILPIVLGDPHAALAAAEALCDRGMLVAAVRPPTVPRGTSRLRITLSCEHSDREVEQMIAAVAEVCGTGR